MPEILYEFIILPEPQQYYEVLTQSVIYLDNHLDGSQRFNLYAVDKFFIEIEYCTIENNIIRLQCFKTGYLLDKYSHLGEI
jgi:hypothetical protein